MTQILSMQGNNSRHSVRECVRGNFVSACFVYRCWWWASDSARVWPRACKCCCACFLFYDEALFISGVFGSVYMLRIPPNHALVLRFHCSMTQRGSWLSAKFPVYCFWFLVFGLLYRHTVSNTITTEMHTSRVQYYGCWKWLLDLLGVN